MKLMIVATSFVIALGSNAKSQSCTSYPYPLTNNTTADATQVMANFNCAALVGGANFTGNATFGANVGVGTSSPYSLLDLGNAITTIKLALYNGSGSQFYGIGVNSGELTFGASLSSVNATPQMVLTSSGLVGIGNVSPTDSLDVAAPVVFGGASGERLSLNTGSIGFNRKVSTGAIYSSGAYAYQFQHSGSTTAASDYLALQIYTPGGANVTGSGWAINGAGQVTVGGGSSSLLFYVNGSAGGTSGWTNVSDGRLKTNIDNLDDGIETIMSLRPVSFDWRAPEDRVVGKDLTLPTRIRQVGFVAQEVASIVPAAVVTPDPGNGNIYGLKTEALVPFLVQAVKEQQAEIRELRAEVAALKHAP